MIKEDTDRIRADIARGYQMGGCFIDAIRDDLLALLHDNELAYHYAQKFQRELLERERELLDAKALLREARDTVTASLAEDGITEARRDYRIGLRNRIDAVVMDPPATLHLQERQSE